MARQIPIDSSAPEAKGHHEIILCCECNSRELAFVEYLWPWNSYVHQCKKCGYINMESEMMWPEPHSNLTFNFT